MRKSASFGETSQEELALCFMFIVVFVYPLLNQCKVTWDAVSRCIPVGKEKYKDKAALSK